MFKITSADLALICNRVFNHKDIHENSNNIKKEAKIFWRVMTKLRKPTSLKGSKSFKIIADILRQRL